MSKVDDDYSIGQNEAAPAEGVRGVSGVKRKEMHDTCAALWHVYCCTLHLVGQQDRAGFLGR